MVVARVNGYVIEPGADLSYAELRDADLWAANMDGANLWGANLIGTKLTGANLSDSDLYSAKLSGADLTSAHANDFIDVGDYAPTLIRLDQAVPICDSTSPVAYPKDADR